MSPTTKPMTFSIGLFPYERWEGVEPMGQVARLADDLGFFGVQIPDHVIMTWRGEEKPPVGVIWYDGFVLSSYLAALTKRVRFIFSVAVVPYRPPVQTAKLISTLDQVSQGRLIFGAGVGWLRGEFRTLGVPFHERGAITSEYLRAMKALWTQESPTFAGQYTSFANIAFEPKCFQKPHVPIWVGGGGPGPLRRVVELGDGWAPMVGTLEDLARDVEQIKSDAKAAGRDPASLDFSYNVHVGEQDPARQFAQAHVMRGREVTEEAADGSGSAAGSRERAIEDIGRHQEAGFNHLAIGLSWEKPADLMRKMEWFAAEVMPAFKA